MPTNLKDAAKTNTRASRFFVFLVLSLLMSCVSVFIPSTTTAYTAAELGLESHDSYDYPETVVWGGPFHVVVDMLNSDLIGQKDERDSVSSAAFLANWLFYFVVAWILHLIISMLLVFSAFFMRFVRAIIHPIDER